MCGECICHYYFFQYIDRVIASAFNESSNDYNLNLRPTQVLRYCTHPSSQFDKKVKKNQYNNKNYSFEESLIYFVLIQ